MENWNKENEAYWKKEKIIIGKQKWSNEEYETAYLYLNVEEEKFLRGPLGVAIRTGEGPREVGIRRRRRLMRILPVHVINLTVVSLQMLAKAGMPPGSLGLCDATETALAVPSFALLAQILIAKRHYQWGVGDPRRIALAAERLEGCVDSVRPCRPSHLSPLSFSPVWLSFRRFHHLFRRSSTLSPWNSNR